MQPGPPLLSNNNYNAWGEKKNFPNRLWPRLVGSIYFPGCHSLRGKCVGEHTHTHTHTHTDQTTNNQLVEKVLKGERKGN